jgi:hypothetical protein
MRNKIFFTEQAKLTNLSLEMLESLLLNNQTTLLIDSDGILKLCEKNNEELIVKNAAGDIIKGLNIDNIPDDFLPENFAYALIAVESEDNFELKWGVISTIDDYNVITGDTTYSVTVSTPQYQIYDALTPGNYDFNGKITIITSGLGTNLPRKYSIDNGLNFTDLETNSVYVFSNLGSLSTESFDLIIKDSINVTLYQQNLTMQPPLYIFDVVGVQFHEPETIKHTVFKSNDILTTDTNTIINVFIEESDVDFPGLYTCSIFVDGVNVATVTDVASKFINIPLDFSSFRYEEGVVTALVNRKNASYYKLGELTNYSGTYAPEQFTWSKDNGNYFIPPSFESQPIILDNEGYVNISYSAEESLGDKTIYARRNSTNEIYQTSFTIFSNETTSTPFNESVTVYELQGSYDDTNFGSIFSSDNFFAPTIITEDSMFWSQSETPPNNLDDFKFQVVYLDTDIYYDPRLTPSMMCVVEDLNGNSIEIQSATLIDSNPRVGFIFEFNFVDFRNTIEPYLDEIIRITFIFNPDSEEYDPNRNIHSNLKYVKYV